jgi:hypothetical protein
MRQNTKNLFFCTWKKKQILLLIKGINDTPLSVRLYTTLPTEVRTGSHFKIANTCATGVVQALSGLTFSGLRIYCFAHLCRLGRGHFTLSSDLVADCYNLVCYPILWP